MEPTKTYSYEEVLEASKLEYTVISPWETDKVLLDLKVK